MVNAKKIDFEPINRQRRSYKYVTFVKRKKYSVRDNYFPTVESTVKKEHKQRSYVPVSI